jgi:hypothetical protein
MGRSRVEMDKSLEVETVQKLAKRAKVNFNISSCIEFTKALSLPRSYPVEALLD